MVDGFTGTVETRCPSCKSLQTYGPDQPVTREIRCPNTWKNSGGGWCGQLVMKISENVTGTVYYKCPRCSLRRTLRVNAPALVST
jgi:DNA-directed RNA polymerase subunit RPC12/RpoP